MTALEQLAPTQSKLQELEKITGYKTIVFDAQKEIADLQAAWHNPSNFQYRNEIKRNLGKLRAEVKTGFSDNTGALAVSAAEDIIAQGSQNKKRQGSGRHNGWNELENVVSAVRSPYYKKNTGWSEFEAKVAEVKELRAEKDARIEETLKWLRSNWDNSDFLRETPWEPQSVEIVPIDQLAPQVTENSITGSKRGKRGLFNQLRRMGASVAMALAVVSCGYIQPAQEERDNSESAHHLQLDQAQINKHLIEFDFPTADLDYLHANNGFVANFAGRAHGDFAKSHGIKDSQAGGFNPKTQAVDLEEAKEYDKLSSQLLKEATQWYSESNSTVSTVEINGERFVITNDAEGRPVKFKTLTEEGWNEFFKSIRALIEESTNNEVAGIQLTNFEEVRREYGGLVRPTYVGPEFQDALDAQNWIRTNPLYRQFWMSQGRNPDKMVVLGKYQFKDLVAICQSYGMSEADCQKMFGGRERVQGFRTRDGKLGMTRALMVDGTKEGTNEAAGRYSDLEEFWAFAEDKSQGAKMARALDLELAGAGRQKCLNPEKKGKPEAPAKPTNTPTATLTATATSTAEPTATSTATSTTTRTVGPTPPVWTVTPSPPPTAEIISQPPPAELLPPLRVPPGEGVILKFCDNLTGGVVGRLDPTDSRCDANFRVEFLHPISGQVIHVLDNVRTVNGVINITSPEPGMFFRATERQELLPPGLRLIDQDIVGRTVPAGERFNLANIDFAFALNAGQPPAEVRFPVCLDIFGNSEQLTEAQLRQLAASLGVNPGLSITDLQNEIARIRCIVIPTSTGTPTPAPTQATIEPTLPPKTATTTGTPEPTAAPTQATIEPTLPPKTATPAPTTAPTAVPTQETKEPTKAPKTATPTPTPKPPTSTATPTSRATSAPTQITIEPTRAPRTATTVPPSR